MFGDNLKTLRKNKGFSQEQLSLRLNVVRQTVSKWEKGLSVPDAEMLVKIAEVLGTSVNELLGEAVAAKNEEGLSSVAMELQKLNELLAMQIAQKKQLAKNIAKASAAILLVLFIIAIYDSWNETWYEFGRNLYRIFH
ncbi:MAG: helix-turn-helix transcriptional regulator [Oscillospiraceae bacterium]|nr:helix-turn-helix transcriptional regulator [Oscillospiraceae bacterium]MBQ6700839.1 helix-turn-helix transcriptional regulator [Oscillospiraceae bacterium]